MATYIPVIGLEIHAQLATQAKFFCPDPVDFGGAANTRVSVISLGHPGTLPSVNAACVHLAIKMGFAMGCAVHQQTYFARKNYFYPDLPKGYQISQDQTPICTDGGLKIRLKNGETKLIRIQRIHLEEDSGKSLHDQDLYDSLIDLNRAGVGLIEIVSRPDLANAEEAMAYLTEIRKIVRYLGVCDGNMEEGSLRCDANISVMPEGATKFGIRNEVKNINSISNLGRAINYEIQRQIEVLESGGRIIQETRTWDAGTNSTKVMREKEESSDYRYFPEPDLQPMDLSPELLARLKAELPELPEQLYEKYVGAFGLPEHDAILLTEQREFASYYEAVVGATARYKAVSNWVNGPVKSYLNQFAVDITRFPLKPEILREAINLVEEGQVSLTVARDRLFQLMLETPDASPIELARRHDLLLETNANELTAVVRSVIEGNPQQVEAYRGGKTGLLGFFVGQVMKETGGKADPKVINQIVQQQLNHI